MRGKSAGEIKKTIKGRVLAGRIPALAGIGDGAELPLRHFAGNGFELRCRTPPEMDKSRNCRPFGRFFLMCCGAKTRCFRKGEKLLG